jgi:hypothetical protein
MEALLAMLLSDRFGALDESAKSQRSPEAEKLRQEIRQKMLEENKPDHKTEK